MTALQQHLRELPALRLVFPITLLTTLLVTLDAFGGLSHDYLTLLSTLPYVAYGLVILLAHLFNQSRVAQTALLMTLAYFIVQTWLQVPLYHGLTRLYFNVLATVLPLNLLFILLLPPRRPLSSSGLLYLLWQLVIALACFQWIITYAYQQPQIWDGYFFILGRVSPLPLITILVNLIAISVVTLCILARRNSSDLIIFTALTASFCTFLLFDKTYISAVLFSFVGVFMLLSIVTRSHRLAYLDELTDIAGRRMFEEDLNFLKPGYTIAMIDIDHFKQFNDSYGHDTGDDVLRFVASQMKHTGGGARVYRYGGEEFAVIFIKTPSEECQSHLEALRERIAQYPLVIRNQAARPDDDKTGRQMRENSAKHTRESITVSIGMACDEHYRSTEECINAADKALYKAKKQGRNQLVVANKAKRSVKAKAKSNDKPPVSEKKKTPAKPTARTKTNVKPKTQTNA
uniref:GGDEF domain-containing protein n=1 Tax=Thaumasiovibrio occultus TaxID=1891184 RepID=UPI000B35A630|nr:GGDEF domain-containing protein [Thaumasiovibrio occultus]